MPKRVYKNIFCGTLLWGVCVPSFLACQVDKKGELAHMSKMMELSKKIDVRIDLYGKVVDQLNHPVEDADVLLEVTRFSPNPASFFAIAYEKHIKTNSQGIFSLRNFTGRAISIRKVKKIGYEYSRKQDVETSFNFEVQHNPNPLICNPNNPLMLRVRKKGMEAFVLTDGLTSSKGPNFTFKMEESGTQKGVDIVQGLRIQEKDLLKPVFNGDPLFCDLKAKASFDPKTKTWTMILTPGGSEGGILFSDRFLYEAPAEGYQPSYTIQPEAFRKVFGLTESEDRRETGQIIMNPGIYLYLRSRTPGIYSRIHITHLKANKDEIYLGGGNYVLNPYGDRNFEAATDLPGEVEIKLEEEIRTAYRHSYRPQKPDLTKLVKEWEKNRPLTDRLKEVFKR